MPEAQNLTHVLISPPRPCNSLDWKSLATLPPGSLVHVHYGGESVANSPQGRLENDAKNAKHSRLANDARVIGELLPDSTWSVYRLDSEFNGGHEQH